MERPTCSTCVYFAAGLKECHRYPPGQFGDVSDARVRSYEGREIYTVGATLFPSVVEGDWCGEHWDFPAFVASLRPAELA